MRYSGFSGNDKLVSKHKFNNKKGKIMNVEQNTPVVTEPLPFDLEVIERDKDGNPILPQEGETEKLATQDEGDFGGEARVLN